MLAFCAALWYNFRQEGGQVVALCHGSRSGLAWELVPRSAGFESYIVKARWPWLFSFACDFPEQIEDFFRRPALAGQFVPELQNFARCHFVHLLSPAFLRISRPGGAFDFFSGNREAEREFHFREPRGMNPFRLRCSDVPLPIASPIRMCKPEETVKGEERKNSRISHALCREIFPAFGCGNGLHTLKARRRRGNRRTPLGAEKEKGKVPL